jgi:ribosomal protein S27AE
LTWASQTEFINKWIREIEIQVYELGISGCVVDEAKKLLIRSVDAGLTGTGHKNATVTFCCLYLACKTCGDQVDLARLLRHPLWERLTGDDIEKTLPKMSISLDIRFCPKCGVSEGHSDKFCGRCGSWVTSNLIGELELGLEKPTKESLQNHLIKNPESFDHHAKEDLVGRRQFESQPSAMSSRPKKPLSETLAEMDAAAVEAEKELQGLNYTSVHEMAAWWLKWFMKAGHKRLGRMLVKIAREDKEKKDDQST